ncbi:MAG: M1 family metallopeptidase [Anaerolineales bacterium]
MGLMAVVFLVGCLCSSENPAGIFGARSTNTPSQVAEITATPSPTITASATPFLTPSPTALSAAEIGAAGIGDPYFPEMGNGGYDVQHYDLTLNVDMTEGTIQAKVDISARSLQTLGRFDLDLNGFNITSVEVNGEDAVFEHDQGELVVTTPELISEGALFTVDVQYVGTPGNQTQNGSGNYIGGWNFYPGGVIVAGEPSGAETWFPSNNHPRDKATYAFHITVAKPYIVAANGILLGQTDRGNGTRTFDWAMDEPMASYLATIAISNFTLMESKSPKGVPIRDYVDADIPSNILQPLQVLPPALDYFTSIFGAYPFEDCGAVVHEFPINFSLEDQTLIIFGDTFLDDQVVVHELSHQWFGDSVSLSEWKDIWLNEGFASYAEVLWLEHTQGVKAMREDLARRYQYSADIPSSRSILIGDPGPTHLFDQLVYDRGALTLHALRRKVGDTAFFKILRDYYDRYRNGNATTADFIAVADDTSGKNLSDFFHEWLYSVPLPDIPELE